MTNYRHVDPDETVLQLQCDNCECWEFDYDMWQCPECSDWICLDDDPDHDGWPGCMVHDGENGGVCADCCCDDCSTCALECCDDCDELWDDCECDDDDDDEDD